MNKIIREKSNVQTKVYKMHSCSLQLMSNPYSFFGATFGRNQIFIIRNNVTFDSLSSFTQKNAALNMAKKSNDSHPYVAFISPSHKEKFTVL